MTTPDGLHDDVLLDVRGLRTHFFTDQVTVRAVDGVDLTIRRGRTLCVVGESGSGKSVMARSILQLVDAPGRIVDGEVLLHRQSTGPSRGARGTASREPRRRRRSGRPDGRASDDPSDVIDLAALSSTGRRIRSIRGRDVAMIFQEPMTSLSLVHRVGNQLGEAIRIHDRSVSKEQARTRSIELLDLVGIPNPRRVVDIYPFQLSGGMRQRVMIAMALSCDPALLIADEPTTALDVTTQAQIMELLRRLQDELGMAMLFITHDMGVVAEMAHDVAVMYLGTVAETGPVDQVFRDPQHPYTRALLDSIPKLGQARRDGLLTIEGMVPEPARRPAGCVFHTRCPEAMPGYCDEVDPPAVAMRGDRTVRCLLHLDDLQRATDDVMTGAGDER